MIAWWLAGVVAVGLPQEVDTDDTDGAADEDTYTVVVVAERRVEMARQALYERARQAGFRREKSKDDRVILRHDQAWKGDLVVHDDGQVEMKRQPVRFEPPVHNPKPVDYLWCVLVPICIRPAGQTYGKRKWRTAEARALAQVRPEVEELQRRLADLGLAQKVEQIPTRIDALWTQGVPLDGGEPVRAPSARREAIAAFWHSRTDTAEGRAVRDAVQAYVRNEVQYSDHPFTPQEVAEINRRATYHEPFLPGGEAGAP